MPNDANERGRDFAKLIRDARHRMGYTQAQVIEMSGVSKTTLIRWEGGNAERPDPEQVRALCHVLEIDPREAGIALGYLRREDFGEPTDQGRKLDPTVLEVIEILEDPRVPTDEKVAWVRYLKFLKEQSRAGQQNAS